MILTCLIALSEEDDAAFRESIAHLGLRQVTLQKGKATFGSD